MFILTTDFNKCNICFQYLQILTSKLYRFCIVDSSKQPNHFLLKIPSIVTTPRLTTLKNSVFISDAPRMI